MGWLRRDRKGRFAANPVRTPVVRQAAPPRRPAPSLPPRRSARYVLAEDLRPGEVLNDNGANYFVEDVGVDDHMTVVFARTADGTPKRLAFGSSASVFIVPPPKELPRR